MPVYQTLTVDDFARLAGTNRDNVPQIIQDAICRTDYTYQKLNQEERDTLILYILKKLDTNIFSKVGQERKGIWEQAWSDRAGDFIRGNLALDKLVPNFFDKDPILRLDYDYIRPTNTKFQHNFSETFRHWLFMKYLNSVNTIYEFGCGSGFNLTALSKIYPDKNLYGLDWAESAIKMVNLTAQTYGMKLQGFIFDFYRPDKDLVIENNSAILTMSALEQIGADYEPFLQFIMNKSPAICVNMEPLLDLYNIDKLPDYLAIRYHTQRHYLEGYLKRLKQLEAGNQINIIKIHRVPFGDLYQDGFSYVVWKPI